MPRTRAELDRSTKVREILEVAVGVLAAEGPDALTVHRVASEVGIARGAVHWYFPSRDDLFAAAGGELLRNRLAEPPASASYPRRIRWAVDTLAEHYDVYAALQASAATSPAARETLVQLQVGLCEGLKELLAPHVPAERLQATADTFVMFAEGLLGRRLDPRERARHVGFALDALVGGGPG